MFFQYKLFIFAQNSFQIMKIAILGTRGIPNYHGGFEQFAEFFSLFLHKKGIDVYVYCSSIHPYKEQTYKGIRLIVCNDVEDKIGTAGQFLYDLNCILDARKRNFDVILQLGYTSSSIWSFLFPKNAIVVTNMDGLEWKRTKYNYFVQRFLKFAEKLAVKHSDYLISDSIGIQEFLQKTYKKESKYIAYGATLFDSPDQKKIQYLAEIPYSYDLLIARMEPENNVEVIIKGYLKKYSGRKLLLVGSYNATKFGKYLFEKYSSNESIVFLGPIYDMDTLNNLRYFSNLYFHGHSVGGTNPSLLEAMACNCCIVAHDNVFNQSILNQDAFYFSDEYQLAEYLFLNKNQEAISLKIENNRHKIRHQYDWEVINTAYLDFISKCIKEKK
jgi:glycosyltransferase involved in cell wall biosynthesis